MDSPDGRQTHLGALSLLVAPGGRIRYPGGVAAKRTLSPERRMAIDVATTTRTQGLLP
jgi:hypothetical protein